MTFWGYVPRRRRRSVVAPPGKEEQVAQNGGGGSRLDGSEASAPSSARARNDGAVVVAPPGKEDPVTQNGGGGCRLDGSEASTSPVLAPNDGAVVVAPTKSEEERLRKGKMVAVDQSPPSANDDDAPRGQPPGDKLAGDAIGGAQSHEDTTALEVKVLAKNNRKRKHRGRVFWAGMGHNGQSTSSAGADMDVSLDNITVVDDRLRDILRDLGVSPVRVYGKKLSVSDRTTNQNRLLMSCKSWHTDGGEPFPFDEIVTEEEKPDVHNKDTGLSVQAYDRDGHPYTLTCKHLSSNNAYRLIGNWSDFLRDHGLPAIDGKVREDSMIELWAFRSRKLKLGVTNQAGGPLGLVMVHYLEGDAAHADAALAGNEDVDMEALPENGVEMPDGEVHGDEVVMAVAVDVDEDVDMEALPENGVEMPDGEVDGDEVVTAVAVDVDEDALPVNLADAVDEQDKTAPVVADEAAGAPGEALLDATPNEIEAAAEALLLLRATGSF